jgi:Flp pilus assembly protein TadG
MGDTVRGFILRRLRNNDRGAQAVEFALISLPLLYLLYGVIAFGFTLNAQITASHLAREGARAAAICGTGSGCSGTAGSRIAAATPAGFSIVSTSITACSSPTGDATVVVTTQPPLAFVPFLTGSTAINGKASTPCGG